MIDVAAAERVVASYEQPLTPWPCVAGDIVATARELLEEVKRLSPPPANGTRPIVFRIPASIVAALMECPRLGAGASRLQQPDYWQAQLRAFERVDFATELRKAEAWLSSNARRGVKRDIPRFLHNWFARAASDLPPEEE